jgi:alkylation response protein AidB-like acyl-CoA dehydrogenase
MAKAGLDGGRLSIGSCSLGAAQQCFETALAYTKERKQFGKPIISNQAIQFKLAEMATSIQTSRLLLRHAALLLDADHPTAAVHCAMAKKYSTDKGIIILRRVYYFLLILFLVY